MKKNFIFILLISLLFAFCKTSYIKSGGREIDLLMAELDDVNAILDNIDTLGLKSKYDEYMKTISILKESEFTEEDKNAENWKMLTLYGQIKKPLRSLVGNIPNYYKELAFSRKQLENLKHDLVNKEIDKTKFEEYLVAERNSIQEFKQNTNIHITQGNAQLTIFDSIHVSVLKILEEIKE